LGKLLRLPQLLIELACERSPLNRSRKMATLAGTYTSFRLLLSYGPGLLLLLLLDGAIWLQRPDIVDYQNRVRDIPAQHIYNIYDFIGKTQSSGSQTELSWYKSVPQGH
jgi:hypothetical protein